MLNIETDGSSVCIEVQDHPVDHLKSIDSRPAIEVDVKGIRVWIAMEFHVR